MSQRLTPSTAALLTIPPLLWAGNAIVGRLVVDLVPPMTFNLLRWALAFLILLPLGYKVFSPSGGLWSRWRTLSVLGLLGVGLYNTLQYLALRTSTPLNVTLVASSIPLWMLAVGKLFFGMTITRRQLAGAALSMAGVLVVLSRGEWSQLARLTLVRGDVYVLAATIAWALYSWLLVRGAPSSTIGGGWAGFLLAQIVYGLVWSALFTASEWSLTDAHITWGWPLAAALAFVAVGPAVLAYRCWGLGVQRAGPDVAGFFSNLSPVFAAVLSTLVLGEVPKPYHAAAFALIVAGILVSSRK